jgi:hypothetical protein
MNMGEEVWSMRYPKDLDVRRCTERKIVDVTGLYDGIVRMAPVRCLQTAQQPHRIA